jgi:arylsulfatase A-like enzyme
MTRMKRVCRTAATMLAATTMLSSVALLAETPSTSPATGMLPRDVLPLPDQPFGGSIGQTPGESRPDWPNRLRAPAGAPNVLLIMSDDVGFASSSTFGGLVPTPNLDRLAQRGLLYNRFHTTALCSPSRAALLTGRNSHEVAIGNLSDSVTGFPGYDGRIPQSAATIARILGLNGYSTAMFGKHHDLPPEQQSLSGPFNQWPTGLGFDYFYGFIGGDVHQWNPKLYRGITPVNDAERRGELLDKRLADDAIYWVHNQKASTPDKPFFAYMATGSLHAPHQAPPEWIARFRGKFDQGWDEARKQIFDRQLAKGVVPKGTVLTERPSRIPAWHSLTADEKRAAARLMEVAAAELSYQDAQIGRVLDELQRMGELDNTLVIFIEGDNGASGEGAELGTTNELGNLVNGVQDSAAWMASSIDVMGSARTYENYPIGWAWAMDTPFRWTKQFASYLGGIRNGLVMSWPKRMTNDRGEVRSQFAHLVDIAPTILDAAGLPVPSSVYGVKQMPLEGTSLVSSFDRATPEKARTQYFEISGDVSIYHDGWFAGASTGRMPWEFTPPEGTNNKPAQWELYDLDRDFSQSQDLAAKYPAKLTEMKALFYAEARRNNVYPIDRKFSFARIAGTKRSAPQFPPRSVYDYWAADTSVVGADQPPMAGRAFRIDAEISVASNVSGVVIANGSWFGGWSLLVDRGRPSFVYAFSNKPSDTTRITADAPLTPGAHTLTVQLTHTDKELQGPASITVMVDGHPVAAGSLPRTLLIPCGIGETMDIGRDTGVPVVTYDGAPDGAFSGSIQHVRVTLLPIDPGS